MCYLFSPFFSHRLQDVTLRRDLGEGVRVGGCVCESLCVQLLFFQGRSKPLGLVEGFLLKCRTTHLLSSNQLAVEAVT